MFLAKLFHYFSGELHIVEKQFERLEDAIAHGIKAACYAYKVYDQDGHCCHDDQHNNQPGHNPYC